MQTNTSTELLCSEIDLVNRLRPPPPRHFTVLTATGMSVACVLWGLSLLWCALRRDSIWMRTVRPFWLNALGISGLLGLHLVTCINLLLYPSSSEEEYDNGGDGVASRSSLPCMVLSIGYVCGLCAFHVYLLVSVFVFSVENARAEKLHICRVFRSSHARASLVHVKETVVGRSTYKSVLGEHVPSRDMSGSSGSQASQQIYQETGVGIIVDEDCGGEGEEEENDGGAGDGNSSAASSGNGSNCSLRRRPPCAMDTGRFRAYVTVVSLILGCSRVDRLGMRAISRIRLVYRQIAVLAFLFTAGPLLCALFLFSPKFVACRGCNISLELIFVSVLVAYVFMSRYARLLRNFRREYGLGGEDSSSRAGSGYACVTPSRVPADRRHVGDTETRSVQWRQLFASLLSFPVLLAAFILTVIDPRDIVFERQAAYVEWVLLFLSIFLHWPLSAGLNMFFVYQERLQKRLPVEAAPMPLEPRAVLRKPVRDEDDGEDGSEGGFDDVQLIDAVRLDWASGGDESILRTRLEGYLAARYCIEYLYFVEDVERYKNAFYSRSNTWKVAKAQELAEVYIDRAAIMELRLPTDVRKRLFRTLDHAIVLHDVSALFVLFDEAVVLLLATLLQPALVYLNHEIRAEQVIYPLDVEVASAIVAKN